MSPSHPAPAARKNRPDPQTETRTDWLFRSRTDPAGLIRPSYILTYSSEEFRSSGSVCTLCLHAEKAFYFLPRVETVTVRPGKAYYIYSRVYPWENHVFRMNMAVFGSDGNILRDGKEAAEIYAKYKLPALI